MLDTSAKLFTDMNGFTATMHSTATSYYHYTGQLALGGTHR